jgi:hypothetical protein
MGHDLIQIKACCKRGDVNSSYINFRKHPYCSDNSTSLSVEMFMATFKAPEKLHDLYGDLTMLGLLYG